MLTCDGYNIRLLSIQSSRNAADGRLCDVLRWLCRPGRPEGTPKLKSLFVFGSSHSSMPRDFQFKRPGAYRACICEEKGQIKTAGLTLWPPALPPAKQWAKCLAYCDGMIKIDAILCRGPRHQSSSDTFVDPEVANYALKCCELCGSVPERSSTEMSLQPSLSSTNLVHKEVGESHSAPSTIFRCGKCLEGRYCCICRRWWCASCLQGSEYVLESIQATI